MKDINDDYKDFTDFNSSSDLNDDIISEYYSYEAFKDEYASAPLELPPEEIPPSFVDVSLVKELSYYEEQIKPDSQSGSYVPAGKFGVNNSYQMKAGSFNDFNNVYPEDGHYSSMVKDYPPKKRFGFFKKFVAVFLIVCLAGGSVVGFGLVVGKPLAQKYFADIIDTYSSHDTNSDTESALTDSAKTDKANFSFQNTSMTTSEFSGFPASSSTLTNIVKIIEPSVVNITSTSVSNYDDFFRSIPREQEGSGSGIIFYENEEKIFIATNAHVIANATYVKISVDENEQVEASLVGWDEQSDVAVISCLKSDIPADVLSKIKIASFGSSDSLEVGEIVIAMGNALGEGKSATLGIISAKNKEIIVNDKKLNVIKTDAAINPGNSGGPLINDKGEVIGINTAKFSQAGVEGTGYAIPIDDAKPIIEQLINTGTVPRPYLGIRGYDISNSTAMLYDLPIGVFVEQVDTGSSAAIAGIIPNDIIIEFGGVKIMNFDALSQAIKSHNVGDSVDIKVIRDGKEALTLKVVLQDANQPKSSVNSIQ